jgi:membrane protein implicated in regulation of membrane protease activity
MSSRVAGLFLTAVLGILVAVGLVLARWGWAVEAAYVALLAVGLVLLARKARELRPQPADDGRTCSCCTTTVFDPIEIR